MRRLSYLTAFFLLITTMSYGSIRITPFKTEFSDVTEADLLGKGGYWKRVIAPKLPFNYSIFLKFSENGDFQTLTKIYNAPDLEVTTDTLEDLFKENVDFYENKEHNPVLSYKITKEDGKSFIEVTYPKHLRKGRIQKIESSKNGIVHQKGDICITWLGIGFAEYYRPVRSAPAIQLEFEQDTLTATMSEVSPSTLISFTLWNFEN